MLHDAADNNVSAIRDGIDVHFNGGIQEMVEKNGCVITGLHGFTHVAFKLLLVVYDFHRAAAQNIRGANYQRVADARRARDGFFGGANNSVRGLLKA